MNTDVVSLIRLGRELAKKEEEKNYRTIDTSLALMKDTNIVRELKKIVHIIKESDADIRQLTSKANSNIAWQNSVLGSEVTPIGCIRRGLAQERHIKGALRYNLNQIIESKKEPEGDTIDLLLGATESLNVIHKLISDTKRINKLGDHNGVISHDEFIKDEAKSAIKTAFKRGYAEAFSNGMGLAQTGFCNYADALGIGVMQFQWWINHFIKRFQKEDERGMMYIPKPATPKQEWDFYEEMSVLFEGCTIRALQQRGYHD